MPRAGRRTGLRLVGWWQRAGQMDWRSAAVGTLARRRTAPPAAVPLRSRKDSTSIRRLGHPRSWASDLAPTSDRRRCLVVMAGQRQSHPPVAAVVQRRTRLLAERAGQTRGCFPAAKAVQMPVCSMPGLVDQTRLPERAAQADRMLALQRGSVSRREPTTVRTRSPVVRAARTPEWRPARRRRGWAFGPALTAVQTRRLRVATVHRTGWWQAGWVHQKRLTLALRKLCSVRRQMPDSWAYQRQTRPSSLPVGFPAGIHLSGSDACCRRRR